MKLKKMKLNKQRGFSLLEILVALALLATISAGIMGAFDGSRSKAQALMASMTETGNANLRLKNDTGCFISSPRALFDRAFGVAAVNNYCNRDFGNTWNGPYVNPTTLAPGDLISAEKIGSSVTIGYDRAVGGIGRQYFTVASNVPNDVAVQFLQECNGLDPSTDNTVVNSALGSAIPDTRKCTMVEAFGGDNVKTVRMIYNQSR